MTSDEKQWRDYWTARAAHEKDPSRHPMPFRPWQRGSQITSLPIERNESVSMNRALARNPEKQQLQQQSEGRLIRLCATIAMLVSILITLGLMTSDVLPAELRTKLMMASLIVTVILIAILLASWGRRLIKNRRAFGGPSTSATASGAMHDNPLLKGGMPNPAGSRELLGLIRETPDNPELHRQLYLQLNAEGRDGAATTFEELIKIYPHVEAPYWYLIATLQQNGDHGGLVRTISTALKAFHADEKWFRCLIDLRARNSGSEVLNQGIELLVAQYPNFQSIINDESMRGEPDRESDIAQESNDKSLETKRFEAHEANMQAILKNMRADERDQKKQADARNFALKKPVSAWWKFKGIKPTGHSDGYG